MPALAANTGHVPPGLACENALQFLTMPAWTGDGMTTPVGRVEVDVVCRKGGRSTGNADTDVVPEPQPSTCIPTGIWVPG